MMDIVVLPPESNFWDKPCKSLSINEFRLRKFLESHRYGLFQSMDLRTSKKIVFHNDKGILKIHNEVTIKSWLLDYLESTPEKEFDSGKFENKTIQVTQGESIKWEVLAKVQKYSLDGLKRVLLTLPRYSVTGFVGTSKLDVFEDDHKSAYIKFLNGVVKVTAGGVDMVNYKDLKDKGAIWESHILPRNFRWNENKGLFETFAEKSLSRKSPKKDDGDWTKNYDLEEDEYTAFRTAYGYLLHSYNIPDVAKGIIFIDCDSDLGKPEGGNGKSLTMKSIKHFKNTIEMSGKKVCQDKSGGGRFQFSTVTYDTKFVFMNDIDQEFKFERLFNDITDDMEIEGKGKGKFVIPFETKPKIGITTNYVPAGTGNSVERRQHVVEFGNYWNHCTKEHKEQPSDEKHLGKSLFDKTFSDEDWNQFYTYGIRCIQEFFQKGLVASPNQNYLVKTRKFEIEGIDGDGVVTSWMDSWLEEDRLKGDYHINDGISEKDLYKKFAHDNLPYTESAGGDWSFHYFNKMFFKYVMSHPDYEYNSIYRSKGDTKTNRRWNRGPSGNQTPHIKVTSPNDPR